MSTHFRSERGEKTIDYRIVPHSVLLLFNCRLQESLSEILPIDINLEGINLQFATIKIIKYIYDVVKTLILLG